MKPRKECHLMRLGRILGGLKRGEKEGAVSYHKLSAELREHYPRVARSATRLHHIELGYAKTLPDDSLLNAIYDLLELDIGATEMLLDVAMNRRELEAVSWSRDNGSFVLRFTRKEGAK